MKTQSPDTALQVEQLQVSLFRQASPARRVALARSLSRSTLQASRRAIRNASPLLSEEEYYLRCIALQYGTDLAQRVRLYLVHKAGEPSRDE